MKTNMKTLPINQRDKWSLLPKNEPTPNAFSASSFTKETVEPNTERENYTRIEIIQAYYEHYKALLFFILWVVSATLFLSMAFQSKYQWIVDTLEAKEERQARMEYNTQVMIDKVSENKTLISKDREDDEALLKAIGETFKKKEAKIVENN